MRLTDNCYVVHGLFTLSPWVVNSGFITGSQKTLIIDAGSNYMSAQTIHGYATCAAPENDLILVNTEPHSDHMGGNCLFAEKKIQIYGHAGINRSNDDLNEIKDAYNDTIVNPVRKSSKEENLLYWNTTLENPTIKVTSPNTQIYLGDFEVELILTPGHSPQNLIVYLPSEKVIYSGDTVVEGYIPNMEDSTPDGWEDWLNSLNLIENLEAEILVPGHGKVLMGNEIRENIEVTRDYLKKGLETGFAPTSQ